MEDIEAIEPVVVNKVDADGGAKVDKGADFANYFSTYAYLYHQKEMLSDRVRMDAYYDAIFKNARHFRGKVRASSSFRPFYSCNPLFLGPLNFVGVECSPYPNSSHPDCVGRWHRKRHLGNLVGSSWRPQSIRH